MSNTLSISLQNDKAELTKVNRALTEFLTPKELSPRINNAVNLVIEELLMNIVQYSFEDEDVHTIKLDVEVDTERIAITLTDDGVEFNPIALPKPDRSRPAMERIENGLGINLVRRIRKAMEYRRADGKNILKIWIDR